LSFLDTLYYMVLFASYIFIYKKRLDRFYLMLATFVMLANLNTRVTVIVGYKDNNNNCFASLCLGLRG